MDRAAHIPGIADGDGSYQAEYVDSPAGIKLGLVNEFRLGSLVSFRHVGPARAGEA